MINVLVFFLALTILFILGICCFVIGVKASVMDNDDNTTLTSEKAEKTSRY